MNLQTTNHPRRKCLFVINGLGMGNSTRCHAVMEEIADAGLEIHVLTSGNGLKYFADKPFVSSLTPMESFFYSGKDGGVSGWQTFKSLGRLAKLAKAKKAQLHRLLQDLQPNVAVIDSEYAISPLKKRGVPIAALNTSEMIVTEYLKRIPAPRGVRSHFWCVEFSDYLFHKHYCNLVLSPFPTRTPTRHKKFKRVGLILRRSIKEIAPTTAVFPKPKDLKTVVFMLSGSVHASNVTFDPDNLPFNVEVVGRDGESKGRVKYHGRLMDNRQVLARADALVINGGYSAVSEAFLLRKPVFVVPVPGHAEQFVNGCVVQDLGLGFVAKESDVIDQLLAMHETNEWRGLKKTPAKFELDGAVEASEAILQLSGKSA